MNYVEQELFNYGLDSDKYEVILDDIDKKLTKQSQLSWNDIAEKYDLDFSGESLRKAQQLPIFGGNFVRRYYESKCNDGVSYSNEYFRGRSEKIKAQTEKLELNRWLRCQARDELLYEKIVESISQLQPLDKIAKLPQTCNTDKEYILFFGDAHFGVEFEILDVHGNSINAYSPQIFEDRMSLLFNKIIDIIHKNNISKLYIVDLGDNIDGILRLSSQLMKLRYGVVESTIKYAEYISNWLNELSKYVFVNYHMVLDSNHTQLRICGAPKNAFPEENMSRIIQAFVKERLKDNDNVCVVQNPSGNAFINVCGYNVLAVHGEVKDMRKALDEYSHIYDTKISYLVAGHYHSSRSEEIAADCAVYNIPSIIGADSYAISLRKKSNAGAVLMEFQRDYGRTCEYNIKLS